MSWLIKTKTPSFMLSRPCWWWPRRWKYVSVIKILILFTKTSTRETNLFKIYSYYNFLLVVFLEIFHLIFKISFMCFLLMVLLIFWWIWFFPISYYWFWVLIIFFLTSSLILSLSSRCCYRYFHYAIFHDYFSICLSDDFASTWLGKSLFLGSQSTRLFFERITLGKGSELTVDKTFRSFMSVPFTACFQGLSRKTVFVQTCSDVNTLIKACRDIHFNNCDKEKWNYAFIIPL